MSATGSVYAFGFSSFGTSAVWENAIDPAIMLGTKSIIASNTNMAFINIL
jgi:hypothetical protein